MNKKRLFFDFLQKHNALEAYKQALNASILRYGNVRVRTSEYIPLGCSFVWDETPEGHVYWSVLCDKWYDYYQSIKKKYHF